MSSEKPRLKVDADIGKNRLFFTVAGTVNKADLDRLYTDVRFCVADLRPGFDVITDLRGCHLGHLSALPTFKKIMHYLITHGVRDVVRVMNPDNLIHRQVVNFAARVPGYRAMYVNSMEEAEVLLEGSAKRGKLRFMLPDKSIVYTIDNQDTRAALIDISCSGCAIKSLPAPPIGRDLSVSLSFTRNDQELCNFTFASRITRELADGFAVEFSDISDADREALQACLTEALQR